MDLASAIHDYQTRQEADQVQQDTMTGILESCRDLLEPLKLFPRTSHATLWLSKHEEFWKRQGHPAVSVWTDGIIVDVTYQESWDDGPFFRRRGESIRCEPAHARAALAEFLNRLNVEPATAAARPRDSGSAQFMAAPARASGPKRWARHDTNEQSKAVPGNPRGCIAGLLTLAAGFTATWLAAAFAVRNMPAETGAFEAGDRLWLDWCAAGSTLSVILAFAVAWSFTHHRSDLRGNFPG
jgi:hypothetical protein